MGSKPKKQSNGDYLKGLARGAAGSILFAFPLLMTMEMWWLGFYLDRAKLLLLLVLTFALLVPLSWLSGFERTDSRIEDVFDAVAALLIGAVVSAIMLLLFGLISFSMPLSEIVGKIAIQTVPASIGAVLARGQMSNQGNNADEIREREQGDGAGEEGSYRLELFIMLVGALFLAFNVAPTEEMILIAFKMTEWHALGLILFSIGILHAFVYALDFKGEHRMPEGTGFVAGVVRYSFAGYGIAVLVSLYVLWTFGRTDGASLDQIAMMTAVLAFPAALGAASARLVV